MDRFVCLGLLYKLSFVSVPFVRSLDVTSSLDSGLLIDESLSYRCVSGFCLVCKTIRKTGLGGSVSLGLTG